MFKEFKNFIAKGNVMDLAVGVIIGSAFTGIVKSLTTNLINPLIGLFIGKIDLSYITFKIGSATFKLGSFLNALINFIIIAFVVFILVKIINKAINRQPKETKLTTSEQLLTDIKDLLTAENNENNHPDATGKDSSQN